MSYRADHGHAEASDAAHDALIVECHQIFAGAAAPANHQHVQPRIAFDQVERPEQTLGRAIALHERRREYYFETAAAKRNAHDVVKGRTRGARHDAHDVRLAR